MSTANVDFRLNLVRIITQLRNDLEILLDLGASEGTLESFDSVAINIFRDALTSPMTEYVESVVKTLDVEVSAHLFEGLSKHKAKIVLFDLMIEKLSA